MKSYLDGQQSLKLATTLMISLVLACGFPTPTPTQPSSQPSDPQPLSPTETQPSPPTEPTEPESSPAASTSDCDGRWVGQWSQIYFEMVVGGEALTDFVSSGKTLILNADCTYSEDWSTEITDSRCTTDGLVNGEYNLSGSQFATTDYQIVTELTMDCGDGPQPTRAVGSAALYDVVPPGYQIDLSGLPDSLTLTGVLLAHEGGDVVITQTFNWVQ